LSHVDELEAEFTFAKDLAKRLEALKQRQPAFFKHQREIFDYVTALEQRFEQHLAAETQFLRMLPEKIKERIAQDKAVLELRKQILELMQP